MPLLFSLSDIYSLLEKYAPGMAVRPDTDIVNELGITGDDFSELMEEYRVRFQVEMEGFLWYFHASEEGGLHSFFRRANEKVKRIPITPQMLLDFTRAGKWNLNYPPHDISWRWWFQNPDLNEK